MEKRYWMIKINEADNIIGITESFREAKKLARGRAVEINPVYLTEVELINFLSRCWN